MLEEGANESYLEPALDGLALTGWSVFLERQRNGVDDESLGLARVAPREKERTLVQGVQLAARKLLESARHPLPVVPCRTAGTLPTSFAIREPRKRFSLGGC